MILIPKKQKKKVFLTFSLVKYLAKNASSDEATVLTLSN
jgi:hypothetical protein